MSCPVKKSNDADTSDRMNSSSSGIAGLFQAFMNTETKSDQIKTNEVLTNKSTASICPVAPNQTESFYNDSTSDFVFGQEKSSNQKSNLSTNRVISSIPKSDFTPDHQPADKEKWVYPSGKQKLCLYPSYSHRN